MDNFLLQAIANELEPLLSGQRLGKIQQLGVTDLALDFRLRDGRWLVIATDPQRLALYLTTQQPRQLDAAARADTAFVSLVKKYLGGARLTALEKLGYDRVVYLDFVAENEDGAETVRRLAIMLTGRAANVLLLEGAQIIASLRTRSEAAESYVEPPPPPDKIDPFLCGAEQLEQLIAQYGGELETAAQRHLLGFTPLYARELACRARASTPHAALQDLLNDLITVAPAPRCYSSAPLAELRQEPGRAEFQLTLAHFELRHLQEQLVTNCATVNQAADLYFTLLNDRRAFLAQRQQIVTQVAAKLKKQRALLNNLQRERANFADAATLQRYGELLLANLHQAVKTERSFRVTDFYDEAQPSLEIPAANKATAQEAAEHYFKLARKARHGLQTIQQRLPEVEQEIAKLENLLAKVSAATEWASLNALAPQTPSAPPSAKPAAKPAPKRQEERLSGVRRYRSSDGYEILVGRADRDNDHLTFRIAKSFDLWFHAADYPGSHVVLRNPQRKPVPIRAITEAAQLAAKFSQARTDTRVAVNYCERKFVSKLKGFAPGQVRLSSFKTVLVEPREAGERLL